jgi:histidine triad (HIT) family protein
MSASDSEFCAIVAGTEPARIVHRDDDTVAFFPLKPAVLGHTLVIPTTHVPDIYELTPSISGRLMATVQAGALALRAALEPEGLNVINSNGRAASQTVFHLHVHLVPRWQDDHIGNIWPPSEAWSETVKDEVADLVRGAWVGFE